MSYSTLFHIQQLVSDEELIQLTDDQGLAINQPVLDAAIGRVDERIDGYLANLAPVPVSPVPALITQYSAKLTLAELYFRRSSASLPEFLAKERADILKHLDELAKGKAKLVGLVLPAGQTATTLAKVVAPGSECYPINKLSEF